MSYRIHKPSTLAEACRLDADLPDALLIAGGTDLVVQMSRGQRRPANLIDISRLPGLSGVHVAGAQVEIGALTLQREAETSPLLAGGAEAVREAARLVGGRQVRNIATVGGNIANASPAADVVPALMALDARLVLAGVDGERTMPLCDFLLGPRRTARRPGEIIASIAFPQPTAEAATAFLKAGRRKAMEIAVVNVATHLRLDGDGTCRDVRIVLGSVGPVALRARKAEFLLEGTVPDQALVREAGRTASEECTPISDVRASADYRRLLVAALVERTLASCVERIASGGERGMSHIPTPACPPAPSQRSF